MEENKYSVKCFNVLFTVILYETCNSLYFFFDSMDIFVHMADKEKISDFLQCALTSIHSKQMQEPLKLIQSNWRE